jgi:uncharacterized damage-inducible protein DinB
MSADYLARELVHYSRAKLQQNLAQIQRCANLLDQAELWQRHNPNTNSAGNLILHLTGNVRQWLVGGLGQTPVTRDRPAEFAERGPRPAAEIVTTLRHTVDQALRVLDQADADTLAGTFEIQGYTVSGVAALVHAVEHFSLHTGQIVHITKTLRNVDLSLYDAQGQRLNDALRYP